MRRIVLTIAVVAAIAASYGLAGDIRIPKPAARRGGTYFTTWTPCIQPTNPTSPVSPPTAECSLNRFLPRTPGMRRPLSPLAQLPAGAVGIDGATQRLLGIRVAPVERSGATRVIRVVGRVVPEDTRVYKVNSGVEGFIRETHDDSVGVLVKKNQTLATYYAPDFLPAASGFLASTAQLPGASGQRRVADGSISRRRVQAGVQQSSGLYRPPAQSRDERCTD